MRFIKRNGVAQIGNNMFWSLVQLTVNLGITFILTSYITENIGVDAYGFVSLANTFISYINIISVALNSFASRYVSISYFEGNLKSAQKYYVSVFVSDVVLCLSVTVPALFFIPKLDNYLSIPAGLTNDVKILFAITIVNYFFTILQTVFNIATFIKNRLDLSYKVKALGALLNAIVMIVLFAFIGSKVYYVAIGTLASTTVILLANLYFSKRLLPEISLDITRENLSLSSIKELIGKGIWNSINSLGNSLNSGLDLIVTNQMLSSIEMGELSVSKKLLAVIAMVNSQISSVFQPKQMESYAKNNIKELVLQIKFSMKIVGFFGEIIIGLFVALGISFLKLWIPTQNIELIYCLTFLCMLGDLVVGSVNPLYYVYTLTGNIRMPSIVTIANGLFNVTMMLILLNITEWGLYCVVGTTIVCNFLINFIWTPLYSSICLKVSRATFYPEIIRHLFATFIIIIFGAITGKLFGGADTWFALVLKGMIFAVIDIVILIFLDFNASERRRIKQAVKIKQ